MKRRVKLILWLISVVVFINIKLFFVFLHSKQVKTRIYPTSGVNLNQIREEPIHNKHLVIANVNYSITVDKTVDSSCVLWKNFSNGDWMKDTCLRVDCIKSLQIKYKKFKIIPPRFLKPEHEFLFYSLGKVKDVLKQSVQDEGGLDGSITVHTSSTYNKLYDCGYKADIAEFQSGNAKEKNIVDHQILCPMLVPDGASFQHFTDGVLPKLIQARDFLLQNPDAKILTEISPKFPLVQQLWNYLGFNSSRLIQRNPKTTYRAKYLVNLCDTPPLHPYLWQQAQTILGVDSNFCGSDVIFLKRSRGNSYNGGRMILNEKEVLDYLSRRFNKTLKVFDSSKHKTLQGIMDIFQNASVIIGVHGGAFFNQLFSSRHTTVIEFMPTNLITGQIPLKHAGAMVWIFASLLRQKFWRVPSQNINRNLVIDIGTLDGILDQIYIATPCTSTDGGFAGPPLSFQVHTTTMCNYTVEKPLLSSTSVHRNST